jgi:hypothetical protein
MSDIVPLTSNLLGGNREYSGTGEQICINSLPVGWKGMVPGEPDQMDVEIFLSPAEGGNGSYQLIPNSGTGSTLLVGDGAGDVWTSSTGQVTLSKQGGKTSGTLSATLVPQDPGSLGSNGATGTFQIHATFTCSS